MVALRQQTERSKVAVAASNKSLSAVALTKKTIALVSDVEEVKNNLELQSREVIQQDETLQELIAKVEMLHDAFSSLSDVFNCEIEEMQKTFATTTSQLQERIAKLEESQIPNIKGKGSQVHETLEERFLVLEETCSRLELLLYESQTEISLVKNASENITTREREAAHVQKRLQISQEDTHEAIRRLKEASCQAQDELLTLKAQTKSAAATFASEIEALASDYAVVRSTSAKQQTQCFKQLKVFQETIDRERHRDKIELNKRVDVLVDAITTQDHRATDAIDNLAKSHARIRDAVDEGLTIWSREIRALSNEIKEKIAVSSSVCRHRHHELNLSLRSIEHRLQVSI